MTLIQMQPNELQDIIRTAVSEGVSQALSSVNSKNSSEEQTLLTAEEVLEKLRVSRTTLNNWRKSNKISPVYLGRKTLYNRADIESIVARGIGSGTRFIS